MNGSNVEALRSLYAAFNRRDMSGVDSVLDDRIEVEETQDLAYAAALLRVLGPRFMILSAGYRGRTEVQSLFRSVWQISEWFEVEARAFEEMNDLVVVPLILRGRSRDTGREGEAETAHLWTMHDGRATRLRVFPQSEAAVTAACEELRLDA